MSNNVRTNNGDGLTVDATRRLQIKKQTLDDAYAAPANFLEIDVVNPITHGIARNRYTDYEVRLKVIHLFLNVYLFLSLSLPHLSFSLHLSASWALVLQWLEFQNAFLYRLVNWLTELYFVLHLTDSLSLSSFLDVYLLSLSLF